MDAVNNNSGSQSLDQRVSCCTHGVYAAAVVTAVALTAMSAIILVNPGLLGINPLTAAAYHGTIAGTALSGTLMIVLGAAWAKSCCRASTPVASQTGPQTVQFDLEIESVKTFIQNVEHLAYNINNPLKVELGSLTYMIWYNPGTKSVNIQNKENFTQRNMTNKLGISIRSEQITIFYENTPLESLDDNKKGLIEELCTKLEEIKTAKDKMDSEKKKFNTDALKLLREFFCGEKGKSHTTESGLSIGEYRMWYRRMEEQPGGASTNASGLFILNIQKSDDYFGCRQSNKLGISVNANGEIESVYVDGNMLTDPTTLFDPDHLWNKQLVEIFNTFLREKAVKKTGSTLTTHLVAIARQPEAVFEKVEEGQMIRFFNDDLSIQDGIDDGGLTRQFFSELARNLFDGASGRKIKVESGIPILKEQDTSNKQEEEAFFKRLGSHLFYPSFIGNYTLGRILDETFFSAIHLFLNTPTIDAIDGDEVLIDACEVFASENHPDWFFNVYKNPRVLCAEEKRYLDEILCLDGPFPTTPDGTKNYVKDLIISGLGPKALAAKLIAQGMLEAANGPAHDLKNTSAENLSNAIQGLRINREDIAARIKTDSSHGVIQQKTEWLKEYIRESDDNEIEKFLVAITGSPTITAATQILIKKSDDQCCHAHTCYNWIDVPTEHTDLGTDETAANSTNKELFINNLKLLYTTLEFDMA